MLEIKPNCECCDSDLPAHSEQAYICSYECTFCIDCVTTLLQNVCPNCGGGFTPRPIRPSVAYRTGVSLQHHPASTQRVHSEYSKTELLAFSLNIKNIAPRKR
ncbi:DUF1272 domain-containing protein [uncultured Paraglaciecola sp.]|uniref:DUF1272 domain-containing protein n=1 Tax=uncultured Paraglaciecola sp. TaxID=1765024 RepID=UPI00259322E6|nr:DUF1272 domain-containing protein [uncultured Paraglaciecola sp.]